MTIILTDNSNVMKKMTIIQNSNSNDNNENENNDNESY
jgi:hypothetical protein